MTGEDRRTAGQTCALLLAIAGGKPSDEAAVWEYGVADRLAAAASGVAKNSGKQIRQKGGKRRSGV